MAVRRAEAAAAEATAVAAVETLRLADAGAVGLPHARPLEPVALRLARPRLRHRHRTAHLLCTTTTPAAPSDQNQNTRCYQFRITDYIPVAASSSTRRRAAVRSLRETAMADRSIAFPATRECIALWNDGVCCECFL